MGDGAVQNPMPDRLTPKAAQSRSDIICWAKGLLLNERVKLDNLLPFASLIAIQLTAVT